MGGSVTKEFTDIQTNEQSDELTLYNSRERWTKITGKRFSEFIFFSKLRENISEFPDYVQTSWPTFRIPDFFQTFQTCRNHVPAHSSRKYHDQQRSTALCMARRCGCCVITSGESDLTSTTRGFSTVWPIFLATKAPISLSNVAQRAQLKFFNGPQRAQQNFWM